MICCGWCRSQHVDAEYVDIGVGAQQVAAATCGECGARQIHFDERDAASIEERRRGWWMGPLTEDVLIRIVDDGHEFETWITPMEWLASMLPAHARLDPDAWPVVHPARVRGFVDALVHESLVLYEPKTSGGADARIFETRCGLVLHYAAAIGETATCFQCLYLRPTKGTT